MVWRGQGLIQGAGVKGGLMQGGKMGWVLGRVMQRGTMTGIWPEHLVRMRGIQSRWFWRTILRTSWKTVELT
jgi:hypothetical protein